MKPVVETTGRFLVFHGKLISAGCPLQKYTKKMRDKTGTYQQAKAIHDDMELNTVILMDMTEPHIKLFRKHLSDITKRSASSERKKFVTRYIHGKLTVHRIA
jgi:hypothetical protein